MLGKVFKYFNLGFSMGYRTRIYNFFKLPVDYLNRFFLEEAPGSAKDKTIKEKDRVCVGILESMASCLNI